MDKAKHDLKDAEGGGMAAEFDKLYGNALRRKSTWYLVIGILLCCFGFFLWAIPMIVTAISIRRKATGDRQIYDGKMPVAFYAKDYASATSNVWLHVLFVIGVVTVPLKMSRMRRMRSQADASIRGKKWFNHICILFDVRDNCLGVTHDYALEFAYAYCEQVSRSDEWFAFSSDRLAKDFYLYISTPVVDECRRRVGLVLKAQKVAPAQEIIDLVIDVSTIGKKEAKYFVLDGGGDWPVVEIGDSGFVFDRDAVDECGAEMERMLSGVDRAQFPEMKKIVDRYFDVPDDIALALIERMDGEFQNLPFEDGRYYVSNDRNDDIGICPTCGMARFLTDEEKKSEGLRYCSDFCRETEEMLLKQGEKLKKLKLAKAGIDAAAFGSVVNQIAKSWDWNKGRVASMSGKAHGLAAEDANTMIDRLTGHKAKVIGSDNAKDGADRLVDGQLIQSKYCATAERSVAEAFSKTDGTYRYMDGGKPMQLEVPKDQYLQAVQEMRQKILDGKVPGVTDPDEATKLIRKGHLTYQQAQNVCKFGTIESLAFDAVTGAVVGVTAGGISFVLTTALGYWQTKDIRKALQGAVYVGLQTGGKTFVAYIITAQVQRIPQVKTFLDSAININFGAHGKAVKSLGDGLSKMAGASKFKNTAANSAVRGAVVTAAATFVVTSAWEIGCYCSGKMSGMQCFKNVLVGGAGIAGGTGAALLGAGWGTAICPGFGTVVGGIIGGLAGGSFSTWLTKLGLDGLIDDDSVAVFRLVQEQIGMIAAMFCMGQREVDSAMDAIGVIVSGKGFVSDVYSYNRKGLGRQYVTRLFKPVFLEVALERPILFDKDVSAKAIGDALQ